MAPAAIFGGSRSCSARQLTTQGVRCGAVVMLDGSAARPGAGLGQETLVVQNSHVVRHVAERGAELLSEVYRRETMVMGHGHALKDAHLERMGGRFRHAFPVN